MSPEKLEKTYNWSIKGTHRLKKVNGRRYKEGRSLLLAISNKKVIKALLVKGPVDGKIVKNFLKKCYDT
jgi:hypothetical protein